MTCGVFDQSTRFGRRCLHLGVCGSVACYKSAELLRSWRKLDIHVSVTLTGAAQHFVKPLLFESLGAFPVYESMFASGTDIFAHLEPGSRADAFVIAPVSADALSRLAQGAASDILSAQILAFDGPLILAPAMNPRMWANKATRANVDTLQERGAALVGPDSGDVACGEAGQGRFAPLSEIFLAALRALAPQDMRGLHVLVTLGATREPWDGMRYWSNPSSGLMGAGIAICAWLRGAQVTAVCGPGCVSLLPRGITTHVVSRAREMFEVAQDIWPQMDIGMFAAAVADFSPTEIGPQKFKKSLAPEGLSIAFRPNPDILATLAAARRPAQKVLGFAAENAPDMQSLLVLAREKRANKRADVLAANCINRQGSGFGSPTNAMAVTDARGREEIWPEQSKADVAWDLCSWLLTL
ncbi:MAG: bifunctional phosphopantothenoylcysteine decarboxylase/phosphopantothenate--cysteine ligase CoaBC [Desulfovibrio sp.]|jgi:phosphopantothenoylcysteine decarboxylase/phosphopantothenate--cysteine ligase|nr:bifunctional phosphopantothenoylcysteine decarboxylase/phosphopantothenate--cysteine ligase CoaBC [Desulfovibrio sp.]